MITLYRVAECDACDEVQEKLRDLVVAHEVIDIEKGQPAAREDVMAEKDFPVIADGERLVSGAEALHAYLQELAVELEEWRKFQVDACYIDDKGKSC